MKRTVFQYRLLTCHPSLRLATTAFGRLPTFRLTKDFLATDANAVVNCVYQRVAQRDSVPTPAPAVIAIKPLVTFGFEVLTLTPVVSPVVLSTLVGDDMESTVFAKLLCVICSWSTVFEESNIRL